MEGFSFQPRQQGPIPWAPGGPAAAAGPTTAPATVLSKPPAKQPQFGRPSVSSFTPRVPRSPSSSEQEQPKKTSEYFAGPSKAAQARGKGKETEPLFLPTSVDDDDDGEQDLVIQKSRPTVSLSLEASEHDITPIQPIQPTDQAIAGESQADTQPLGSVAGGPSEGTETADDDATPLQPSMPVADLPSAPGTVKETNLIKQLTIGFEERDHRIRALSRAKTELEEELTAAHKTRKSLEERVKHLERKAVQLTQARDQTARLAKEKVMEAVRVVDQYKKGVDADWTVLNEKYKQQIAKTPAVTKDDVEALRAEIKLARVGLIEGSEANPWLAKDGKKALALAEDLKRENERLNDKLDSSTERIDILKTELGARVEEIIFEREKSDKQDLIISRLEVDARSLQNVVANLQTLIEQEKRNNQDLLQSLCENARFEAELAKSVAIANDYAANYWNAAIEVDSLKDQLATAQAYKHQAETLEAQVCSLNDALEAAQDSVGDLTAGYHELEQTHRTLQIQHDENLADLALTQSDLEDITELATDLRLKVSKLQEASDVDTGILHEVQTNLESARVQITGLQSEVTRLTEQRNQDEGVQDTLSMDLAVAYSLVIDRQARLEELEALYEAFQTELAAAGDARKELETQLSAKQNEVNLLRISEDNLMVETADLEQAQAILAAEKARALSLAAERAQAMESLKSDLGILQRERDQLSKDVMSLRKQLENDTVALRGREAERQAAEAENRVHRKLQEEVKQLKKTLNARELDNMRQCKRLAELEPARRNLSNQPGFSSSSKTGLSSEDDRPNGILSFDSDDSHGELPNVGDRQVTTDAESQLLPLMRNTTAASPPQSHARRALACLRPDEPTAGGLFSKGLMSVLGDDRSATSTPQSNKRKAPPTTYTKSTSKKTARSRV